MDHMNMNTTSSSNTTMDSSSDDSMGMQMMMKAYLHFTPGDPIIFDTIVPTSAGGIFGTCLILFLISVGDRYLRAFCRGMERRFAQRAQRLTTAYYFNGAADNSSESQSKTPVSEVDAPRAATSSRFILSHELSRGFLAGLQTTVHYFLMLVVMTFNAAYIISVVLGVVVGEVAFGRLNH